MTEDRTFLQPLERYVKWTSLVRRLPPSTPLQWRRAPASEGDIGLFEMAPGAAPILVESVTGRFMTLIAGDLFLATPGFRESTRWVVGHVPTTGLEPGADYWVLADSGLIGELDGASVLPKVHLGRARLVGVLTGPDDRVLNLSAFAPLAAARSAPDRGVPLTVILGTSAEVGKTTAGLAVLHTLLANGRGNVVALKATGTASVQETARYADYGARQTFDCIDFGLPTTYPSNREGIGQVFETALGHILSLEADAIIIECGGDLFGANVPTFLECLKRRRPEMRIVLAASDAAAAIGSKSVLDGMGLEVGFFTGPCTDTPTLRARTERLSGRPAMNLMGGSARSAQLESKASPDSIIHRTKRAVAAFAGDVPGVHSKHGLRAKPTDKHGKAASALQWHRVDFTMEAQREIEWCWAADAVSIDAFFDPSSTMQQCKVAATVLGQPGCCANPSSPACDQPHSMDDVLRIIGHLREHLLTPLSFAKLKHEIDSGRPLCTHIEWETGGGHIPLITGYRESFQTLAIADPLYGESEVDYAVFETSYQQAGQWNESYYLK